MATKICSRREKCVHGNVRQDYSNFAKDVTKVDFHKATCNDCIRVTLKKTKDKNKDVFRNIFI